MVLPKVAMHDIHRNEMGLFDALIYLVRMYFSPLAHHLSNHDGQNV